MKLSSYFTDVAKGTTRSSTSSTWPPFKPHKTISCTTKYDTLKNVKSGTCDTGKSAAVQKDSVGEMVEMATKALKSKRLFSQPDNTGSILELAKYQFKGCVTLTIDSENPCWDFRNSMEEMVETYGLKRWKHLEDLLASYMRMNRKNNHGLINIKAFLTFLLEFLLFLLLYQIALLLPLQKTKSWLETDNEIIQALLHMYADTRKG